MRRWRAVWALVALLAGTGAALAQDTPTVAVSRQVTMHAFGSRPTTAVSRQITVHSGGVPLTHATSRQVTVYQNYRLADAVNAMRITAGLDAATGPAATVYNVVGAGPAIDMSDVAEIARLAAGTVVRP